MEHTMRLSLVLLVLVGLLVGCGKPAADEGGAASADAALKVTGMVDKEMGWTEDEVKALDTMETDYTNKDGETTTYTGVAVSALLDLVGAKADATKVAFVAADGYSAELDLSEIGACTGCIVGFQDGGGFRTVFPDFPGNVQVKDLVEIQVK